MALALVERGKRVGVVAQSHRVDRQLPRGRGGRRARGGSRRPDRPARRRAGGGLAPTRASNGSRRTRRSRPGSRAASSRSSAAPAGCGPVTTWPTRSTSCSSTRPASCRSRRSCAVAGSARSLVLLGDPNQLPQVSQGTHPEGAEASALEHLLGGARTIAPDRGLFLETTYRLHPDVNDFISDAFYEGRLVTDEANASQDLGAGAPVGGEGVRFVALRAQRRTQPLAPRRPPGSSRRSRRSAAGRGRTARATAGRSTSRTFSSSRRTTPRSPRSPGSPRSDSASCRTSGRSTSSRAARRRSRSTR